MTGDLLERLKSALLELDKNATLAAVHEVSDGDGGVTPSQAVDAVAEALQVVGARFQEGEWFVGELVYAGDIAKEAMDLLSPLLAAGVERRLGTIVVGTVAGDLHDLGKNIFVNYARAVGFETIDLGVDVPPTRFVDAVKQHRPLALGLSCLLTSRPERHGGRSRRCGPRASGIASR